RADGKRSGGSLLGTEVDGKRQEILIEAVPGLRRMAALADVDTTSPRQLQGLQDAARARGVELSLYRIAKAEDIAPAIDSAKVSNAAALNVLASPLLFANRPAIIERAATLRLPAIYQWPEVAEEGAFIDSDPPIVQLFRHVPPPH